MLNEIVIILFTKVGRAKSHESGFYYMAICIKNVRNILPMSHCEYLSLVIYKLAMNVH